MVDDSLFSRKRAKETITQVMGQVEFVEFADGEAALAGLPEQKVEFVALDLVMPKLDGFGVLAGLQAIDYKTPIFVVSTDVQACSKEHCLQLGCQDFIDKPINAAKLARTLSRAEIKLNTWFLPKHSTVTR